MTIDRRKFLASFAAAAVASTVDSYAAIDGSLELGRIDVHQHWFPGGYLENARSHGVRFGGGRDWPAWSYEAALSFMDRMGIAGALLSVAPPGWYFGGNPENARLLARAANEQAAAFSVRSGSRFGFFATTPLPDFEGAAREAIYALDQLQADGVGLFSSAGDAYIGDSQYDELLAELNRRNAVVYVHPTATSGSDAIAARMGLPSAAIEFMFDTTRAIVNLINTGAAFKYRNIRFIFAHLGAAIPSLIGRLTLLDDAPYARERFPAGVRAILRSFYYDTAVNAAPESLLALNRLVGSSQLLYGSDFPHAGNVIIERSWREVDAFGDFSDADRKNIYRYNGIGLFPRFRPSSR